MPRDARLPDSYTSDSMLVLQCVISVERIFSIISILNTRKEIFFETCEIKRESIITVQILLNWWLSNDGVDGIFSGPAWTELHYASDHFWANFIRDERACFRCNFSMFKVATRRESFSKSYSIKPESDCIYHFSMKQTDVRLFPNQSENGKYNLILVWFNKISKRFLCVRVTSFFSSFFSAYFVKRIIIISACLVMRQFPQSIFWQPFHFF